MYDVKYTPVESRNYTIPYEQNTYLRLNTKTAKTCFYMQISKSTNLVTVSSWRVERTLYEVSRICE